MFALDGSILGSTQPDEFNDLFAFIQVENDTLCGAGGADFSLENLKSPRHWRAVSITNAIEFAA